MKILLVTATQAEIQPFLDHCKREWKPISGVAFSKGAVTLEILITGVGMVRTAYALGRRLARDTPDLCINAGIAGAFPGECKIGDVVHVVTEKLSELGAEAPSGKLLRLEDIGIQEDISSSIGLYNADAASFAFLPIVSGITVNTVHGSKESIDKIIALTNPDIETMESAAFFYCCLKEKVQFLAIRSISNLVEVRDKSKWDIPKAITNLNTQLLELVSSIAGGS